MFSRKILVGGFVLAFFLISTAAFGQKNKANKNLVQFSGLIITQTEDGIEPVQLANVLINNSGRGTSANWEGFFSLVATKGDTITFSAIGFENAQYVIPDTIKGNRFTIYQEMTVDPVLLPEAVIYPWPSKEHFREEFLALEVPKELEDNAGENLSSEKLDKLIEFMPRDGQEVASFYLRQQAQQNYYNGQTAPQNIFSPLAWAKFFKALKRGDFKNKKKKATRK